MKILAIETSCDETAISVVDASGTLKSPRFKILSKVVHSQVALHAEWQGVVPCLAKREHAKNLIPVLETALKKAKLLKATKKPIALPKNLDEILAREQGLLEAFRKFALQNEIPKIDLIAVTSGPGLEPALWTGINLAKALGFSWKIPVTPINHMEGHILSVLIENSKAKIDFPAVALLISGGHTELVLIKTWLDYEIIGRTRDDAVGEAFDKVARMLGLPYPGGPEISRLAKLFDEEKTSGIILPRPMIDSPNFDFSFSGLKTSVLYKIRDIGKLSESQKIEFAHEFENSVTDVLVSKSKRAISKFGAKTFIIGGGVSANEKIRKSLAKMISLKFPKTKYLVPEKSYSTDNATMIAIAGFLRNLKKPTKFSPAKIMAIKSEGNLSL